MLNAGEGVLAKDRGTNQKAVAVVCARWGEGLCQKLCMYGWKKRTHNAFRRGISKEKQFFG